MDLNVKYLGLKLDNPIIVSSSPFTGSLEELIRVEKAGAGAVVLKSIFEEQIMNEVTLLESYSDYPEAMDYLRSYVKDEQVNKYTQLIKDAKQTLKIPVIASINCRMKSAWTIYAKSIEDAGADALELNIFIMPRDAGQSSESIEEQYLEIVDKVTRTVKIPVVVKLGLRFTNVLAMCDSLYKRSARGVVMFNRYLEPDFDIDTISLVSAPPLSSHSEFRNTLRMIGICEPLYPKLHIVASTGIHSGEDVVKSILAGARAVQICSALYISGFEVIEEMKEFLAKWMKKNNFASIPEFRGILNHEKHLNEELYQRVQYMKFFPK